MFAGNLLSIENQSCYSTLVGQQSIAISFVGLSVCVSVCLSVCEHISATTGPIFTKFGVQIPCGHGSVHLWQRCDTLCTYDFMDEVMFGRNGMYGNAWKAAPQPTTASGIVILGRSLMSTNTLFFLCKKFLRTSS